MDSKYLAIENDIDVHERESVFWLSRGISSVRVSTMQEAIEKAIAAKFLYIGINAANTDYMPMLRLLREATNDPILISTTNYSKQEHRKATNNGADLYGELFDNPDENFDAVMACINNLDERVGRKKAPLAIKAYSDFLIAPSHHRVFVNDIELHLTKNEMGILYHLIINRGGILSNKQIFQNVFDGDYEESSPDVIYSTFRRLRSKIKAAASYDYIENVRDVGYRLRTRSDRI